MRCESVMRSRPCSMTRTWCRVPALRRRCNWPSAPPGRVPSTGPRRRAGVGTGADWFVVAVGEGQLPDAPVVVPSRHRSQPAARIAWVEAIRARQPATPAGEVIEVRAASTIAARIEWDQDARRPVVRPGPPGRNPAAP